MKKCGFVQEGHTFLEKVWLRARRGTHFLKKCGFVQEGRTFLETKSVVSCTRGTRFQKKHGFGATLDPALDPTLDPTLDPMLDPRSDVAGRPLRRAAASHRVRQKHSSTVGSQAEKRAREKGVRGVQRSEGFAASKSTSWVAS